MTPEQVEQVRERLQQELRSQSDQIQKLMESVRALSRQQSRMEQMAREQFDSLTAGSLPAGGARLTFEKLLSSVRNLITATDAEQVFESLTEEADQMGVRCAVFDIRGKAAWGFSAKGFDGGISRKALRALVIPLNQDNPFRRVYDIGGHVDLTVNDLHRNRNVVNAFKPSSDSQILLLPIRSAGSVTAIFYCDPKAESGPLPVDALKILTEFAGAQIDRLMALSGEIVSRPTESPVRETAEPAEPAEPVEVVEPSAPAAEPQPSEPEPAVAEPVAPPEPAMEAPAPESAEAAPEPQPEAEATPEVEAEAVPEPSSAAAPAEPPAAAAPSLDQLSEADQKIHKDAKRFAKLLVSEIELYNKVKVGEARKNKDIYHRLKSDIDRSRQTYERRFGSTLGKQFDYFHEELVRLLAENDPSALGSDYPGSSA